MNRLNEPAAAPHPVTTLKAEIQDVINELALLSEILPMLDRRTLYLNLRHAKARQENLLCRVDLECSGQDSEVHAQLLAFGNAQRDLLHQAALLLYPDEWGAPALPASPERVAGFLLSRRRSHAHV